MAGGSGSAQQKIKRPAFAARTADPSCLKALGMTKIILCPSVAHFSLLIPELNGDAGNPVPLNRFPSGLFAQS